MLANSCGDFANRINIEMNLETCMNYDNDYSLTWSGPRTECTMKSVINIQYTKNLTLKWCEVEQKMAI